MRAALRLLATLLAVSFAGTASAQPLVADLSNHLIAMTTGFSGAELLLFGAVEDEGDVVVVVRGPKEDILVRRKERIGVIWVNRTSLQFSDVPSYYALATNRPLDEIAPRTVRMRNEIGISGVRLRPSDPGVDKQTAKIFRRALIRNKRNAGLYKEEAGTVKFLGKRLFRTTITFPSTTPTGTYFVTVYLVRNGNVVSAQSTPLNVSKIGLEARIFQAAHQHSALYGVFAILMALFAGWLAGAVFRRI